MAFEEFKEDLMGAEADMRSYIENSEEYFKLHVFKVLMRFLTTTMQKVLVGFGIVFVLFFLSLGASLALCEILDSYYLGFIIVGGFYILVSALFYVFRQRLNGPLLRKFSPLYFDGL